MHKQNKQAYLNMVGLAFRAGQCILGEEKIIKAIKLKQASFVLIAEDCGPSTFKKVTDKCKTYGVSYQSVDARQVLGQAIGKESKALIAISDVGFSKKIKTLLSANNPEVNV